MSEPSKRSRALTPGCPVCGRLDACWRQGWLWWGRCDDHPTPWIMDVEPPYEPEEPPEPPARPDASSPARLLEP
jgi:hypothetical protein